MTGHKRIRNAELREWVYAAESTIHGTGLFAARGIRKGEYIGTYRGAEAKRNGTYVLWACEEGEEDNTIGRNLLRYLNHCCPGNTAFDGFDLYATRAIRRGEELTFDYLESEFD